MFEARLVNGLTFKQIIEAIKELVTDANLDCNEDEISMQCMDSAHVSLVAMQLSSAAFDHFRCDRALALGINSANMSKILKMMGKDDLLVLKAEDDGDKLVMMFENEKTGTIADFGKFFSFLLQDFCTFGSTHSTDSFVVVYDSCLFCFTELKLMEINADQLGVPDTPYKVTVKMPSDEFQRVVRDLQVLGDTCKIGCSKEGIRFSVSGNLGTGNILIRANASSDK